MRATSKHWACFTLVTLLLVRLNKIITKDSHLAFKSSQQLPGLTEDCQVEVVVVVSDADFSRSRQADANWKVAHCRKNVTS